MKFALYQRRPSRTSLVVTDPKMADLRHRKGASSNLFRQQLGQTHLNRIPRASSRSLNQISDAEATKKNKCLVAGGAMTGAFLVAYVFDFIRM